MSHKALAAFLVGLGRRKAIMQTFGLYSGLQLEEESCGRGGFLPIEPLRTLPC